MSHIDGCPLALYSVPNATTAYSGNQLGIYEGGDWYRQGDLDSFFSLYYPSIPAGTHPVLDSIDGGEAPGNSSQTDVESSLDFSIAYPIIWPQQIKLFQVNDIYNAWPARKGFGNVFLDALDASYCTYEGGDNKTIDPLYPDNQTGGWDHPEMCGTYNTTNVISLSYSVAEGFYSPFYVQRQCNEYMKLSLQVNPVHQFTI